MNTRQGILTNIGLLFTGKKRLSPFQTIILGFAAMILLGAFLLMLPVSSASGTATPFSHALFTSTSAVCVTGLVVYDTATHWSLFGHMVLLLLIQIGGLGVVTVSASVAMISGRKIGLLQRSTMQEAIAAPKVGGVVRLTGFILRLTFVSEAIGAVLMAPVFCRDFGFPRGLFMAVFHSVSAFCNAGFDLLGKETPFVSLTGYAVNPVINLTIIALIVFGGIGFLTWDDVWTNRTKILKYRMQSKVIFTATAVLVLAPAVYFYFFEFSGNQTGERILLSLFQSVTARTAGFNTADLTKFSEASVMIFAALMLIGGSPGSTAGGMKTTTISVLLVNCLAVFRKEDGAHCFGRRIPDQAVKMAGTVLIMYLALFLGGAIVISVTEGLPMVPCLFETASAIGTVGLTLGLTPHLGLLSRSILIGLMYFGRVGGLTLIYAALSNGQRTVSKLPLDKITVG